jgi:hypothetical protein
MNPQQHFHHDGRLYVVETVSIPTVTEITEDGGGREVDGLEAAQVLVIAAQKTPLGIWAQSELSETLIGRFELEISTQADPFVRAALAFAVHTLISDPELAEELDRMQTGGLAA